MGSIISLLSTKYQLTLNRLTNIQQQHVHATTHKPYLHTKLYKSSCLHAICLIFKSVWNLHLTLLCFSPSLLLFMQRASRWPCGPMEHCTGLLSDPQTHPKLWHQSGRKLLSIQVHLIQKTGVYLN